MDELRLLEAYHPDRAAAQRYDSLLGLDSHKEALLSYLAMHFDTRRIERWSRKHHRKGLPALELVRSKSPLILLSGDVGCGKTALANTVGTPLAKELDRKVVCLETPSDLRGWGRVGEISARVTSAFEQAEARARDVGCGVLIIDEGDDLATDRSQMQAHHEDRAGLNVLVKRLDNVARSGAPLTVLLITNRLGAIDPAIVRRAGLHLTFQRPDAAIRREVFARVLDSVDYREEDLDTLVRASEQNGIPYSFSDITERLVGLSLRRALATDRPFGVEILTEVLATISPSPLIR